MGDFDSIKIGVCDAYWTPPGSTTEIFLGLTKGGCDLTYTPEWYDLSVDRYGNSPTDSSLVGESISVRIPLAETDINKLEMFLHTAKKVEGANGKKKLVFGRFPGFRLGQCAGRLRLHPVAMGLSREEDVIIYKAVNKAPLELNYRIDGERIFQTEFVGMIKRNHVNGALLWEMGDSTIGDSSITLSETKDAFGVPVNLLSIVEQSGGSLWLAPANQEATTTKSDANLRRADFKAYTEFNGNVYDVTHLVGFTLPNHGVWYNGRPVVKGGSLPDAAPDLVNEAYDSSEWATVNTSIPGRIMLNPWEAISVSNPYRLIDGTQVVPSVKENWRPVNIGDQVLVVVEAKWGTLSATASILTRIVE